jgi:alkanal monooxygenase alpha chain
VKLSVAAEELGFDAVWLLEHHFSRYGLLGSPFGMAGYVLGKTTRLKVGTAINVVTIDHPLRLAENVAMLDQLSGGRFYFGVGRGGFVKDFQAFGVDMASSRERMDEWMRIMHEAWETGSAESHSEFIEFNRVPVYPEPFTKPHPPIYTVASSPSTVEWAARKGYPMLLNYLFEDEEKISQLELYGEVAAAAGHDPASIDHALSCMVSVCEDDQVDEAKTSTRNYLGWWMEEYVRASQLYEAKNQNIKGYEYHQNLWRDWANKGDTSTDARVNKAFRLNPFGGRNECIEKLHQIAEVTGLRHFICGFENLGAPEKVIGSMRMFMEDVVPAVEKLVEAR